MKTEKKSTICVSTETYFVITNNHKLATCNQLRIYLTDNLIFLTMSYIISLMYKCYG